MKRHLSYLSVYPTELKAAEFEYRVLIERNDHHNTVQPLSPALLSTSVPPPAQAYVPPPTFSKAPIHVHQTADSQPAPACVSLHASLYLCRHLLHKLLNLELGVKMVKERGRERDCGLCVEEFGLHSQG
jgi:hypothetical protein